MKMVLKIVELQLMKQDEDIYGRFRNEITIDDITIALVTAFWS